MGARVSLRLAESARAGRTWRKGPAGESRVEVERGDERGEGRRPSSSALSRHVTLLARSPLARLVESGTGARGLSLHSSRPLKQEWRPDDGRERPVRAARSRSPALQRCLPDWLPCALDSPCQTAPRSPEELRSARQPCTFGSGEQSLSRRRKQVCVVISCTEAAFAAAQAPRAESAQRVRAVDELERFSWSRPAALDRWSCLTPLDPARLRRPDCAENPRWARGTQQARHRSGS